MFRHGPSQPDYQVVRLSAVAPEILAFRTYREIEASELRACAIGRGHEIRVDLYLNPSEIGDDRSLCG